MADELPELPEDQEYLKVAVNVPKRTAEGYDEETIATVRERVAHAAEVLMRRA